MTLQRKSIRLLGSSGMCLHLLTMSTSKQMLPMYDKPMVISKTNDLPSFRELSGGGSRWALRLDNVVRPGAAGFVPGLHHWRGLSCRVPVD